MNVILLERATRGLSKDITFWFTEFTTLTEINEWTKYVQSFVEEFISTVRHTCFFFLAMSVSRMHTFRLLCCLNRISWCLFSAKRACQTRYSEPDHFILQIKWENIIRQTVQVCIAAPQHQTKFVKVICFLQRQKQSLNKNNNAVWYLVSRLLTAQGKHTLIVLKLKTDVARYFLHLHYSLLALL